MISPRIPDRSIVIAGVQRSGTSLLCEAFKANGNGGKPTEFFLSLGEEEWIQDKTAADIRAYLSEVLEAGTTPNDIFGINIMWNTHCSAQETLRALPEFARRPVSEIYSELFSDITYVWIRRRDRVRQAVSWAKAAQTGMFKSDDSAPEDSSQEPTFDFEFIDNLHGLVCEGERGWAGHFEGSTAQPIEIFYEDLVADFTGVTSTLFERCAVPATGPLGIEDMPLKKQADGVNDEWVQRYLELRGEETATETDATQRAL